MLLFSILDTAAKYVSRYMPALEVVWARYAVSLIFAVIILRPWANLGQYVMKRPYIQVLRGLFLLGSTAFNFVALRYLQLAETAAIAFAAPFFIVGLAGPVLGEWAGPRRWAAAVIGFIGVIIVVQPGPGHVPAGGAALARRRLLLRRLQPHHPPPQPHRVAGGDADLPGAPRHPDPHPAASAGRHPAARLADRRA